MSARCSGSRRIIKRKLSATRRVDAQTRIKLTKLGLLLLVSLARLNALLSLLGLDNSALDSDEPAITLGQS